MGSPSASVPGAGARDPNVYLTQQQQMNPLDRLRSVVERPNQGGTRAAGSIQWENYGDARYEDQALRDIRNEAGGEADLNQVLTQKYAAAATEFYNSVMSRQQVYYPEFKSAFESFRLARQLQTLCPIRDEFITAINRHPEMIGNIVRAAAPMYGQDLIGRIRKRGVDQLERRDYIDAIHFAVRAVLTMELISWLCKTPQGRAKAFSLPAEIKEIVGNLEKYKDVFGVAAATFNVSNPYAGLVYDVQMPTRTDVQLIAEAQNTFFTNHYSFADNHSSEAMDIQNLQQMVQRRALGTRAPQKAQSHQSDQYGSWDKVRTDFKNINIENKGDFDYKRFFHNIGKKNHYLITETDWKNIKHAFQRHPEQPSQEESVMYGSFRIVIMDLDNDTGWFSTVVRGDGLDMATLLTNPEKLLPKLEADPDSQDVVVSQIPMQEAVGKKNKTLEIPLETCNTLKGIPLVTINEKYTTNSSKKLNAMVVTSNDHLTKNFKNTNATSFNTAIWDIYTCESADERTRLVDDLPFLFKDSEVKSESSFCANMQKLDNYFDENIVGDEVKEFIDSRLTATVNDWLINSLGYDKNPNSPNSLSVTSILSDYLDLDDMLEEDGDDGYRYYNAPGGPLNYLTEQMKIFTLENKYAPEQETLGVLQKAQALCELIIERPMHITVINKRRGPFEDADHEVVVIKRSKFPEYFDLVEKGFEPTMGDDKDISVTDKIVQFSADEHLWLFNYTLTDRNVATLRRISRRQSLLYMSLT